jgi:hypothetical protein
MAEIGRKLISYGQSSDNAHGQLHLAVSDILRILVMHPDEVPSVSVTDTPLGVNFLQVSGTPAVSANHIQPIPFVTVGQWLPVGELLLISLQGTQIASGQTL